MNFRKTLLLLLLVGLSGWVGFWIGEQRLKVAFTNWKPAVVLNKTPSIVNKPTDADFALFWTVWDTVYQKYVDKQDLNPKKMVDGAIMGMVASIGDPYTMYLPVVQNKATNEDLGGAFDGVGIQLGYVNNQLAVMTPLDGSPAMKAGVKTGDLILKIRDPAKNIDKVTTGMSAEEAVNYIRGDKGTTVYLTFYRTGVAKPFEVALVRDEIVVKSVTVQYLDQGNKKVPWIKLTKFGERTSDEWNQAVMDMNNQCGAKFAGCKGIVLDLRNNPGGYLEMAVYIAGEFLPPGKLVVTQQYGDGHQIINNVDRNGSLMKVPLSVIVNGGSASAAEILTGALQDYKRATVFGVKSFGKGSVQEPQNFPDGSGLHVTVAKWLRPSGVWLDKKGITPDVVVQYDTAATDSAKWQDDPQLVKAVNSLK
jgi:carboxyl-terminal processing protease